MILQRDHLRQGAVETAQLLLGCSLVKNENGKILSGRIVETEAYCFDDPACHAYRGKTKRNAPMFGDAGFSYVYFTYGMHHCFNVTANVEGVGEAVLIRALEPVEGIELMYERRIKAKQETDLLNGPAKIAQAFALTTTDSSIDLLSSDVLRLEYGKRKKKEQINASPRIGITQAADKLWRFTLEGSLFLSR
jgi:DNA-3-methyladenine glycosylase